VKNAKFYVPYILTSFITITMFYTLQSFVNNSNLPKSASFRQLMGFGLPIVLLFSAIFLFYTNSFLIRRRKTEFGLFNILGMEKRHITALIVIETVIIAVISLVFGIGFGVLTNKLLFLLLNKIVDFVTPLVFEFSLPAVTNTVCLFALIYLAILIKNIIEVLKVKPIELLSSERRGEKEPKARWIISVFGIVCVVSGYLISVTCADAYHAIILFFVAVMLVIVGTYCLFMSGTIALLKLLKNNKDYYYKPRHFSSISGMLFRMKQNGVGLANICILSTMVIVMIGTTVSLYAGASDIINTRFGHEVVSTFYDVNDDDLKSQVKNVAQNVSKETGIGIENYREYKTLEVTMSAKDGVYEVANGINFSTMEFYRPEDFENLYEIKVPEGLKPGVLYVAASTYEVLDTINFLGKDFEVINLNLSKPKGQMSVMSTDSCAIIVPDEETYNTINELQTKAYTNAAGLLPSIPSLTVEFDLDCSAEDEYKFYDKYEKEIVKIVDGENASRISLDLRQDSAKDFAEFTGSFLFLGVFLGVLFLMATVLIMYYKQIVEGYDDRRNFEIMQNVGMDKSEVKKTISGQVLILFFLPLLVAFLHMGFALPILAKLLSAFAITNVKLVIICCGITCLIYAVIYAIVYSFTSKTYYRIVN